MAEQPLVQRQEEKKFHIEGFFSNGKEMTPADVSHESFKSMIICRLRQKYDFETREDFTIESGHLCLPGEELVFPLSAVGIDYWIGMKDMYFFGALPPKYQEID